MVPFLRFRLEEWGRSLSKTVVKRIPTYWLLAFLSLPVLQAAETRIWTSRKGSTIDAELLKQDATSVILLGKDGKQMPLKMEDISIADRQYLVEELGADPKILIAGEVGEPEKQVRFESSTLKKMKVSNLTFGTETESQYELLESEHFLIATAGDVRAQSVAETAERLWHGMAFQHMNFRRDWADKKMLILLIEKPEVYKDLGKWYVAFIKEKGKDEIAGKIAASWEKSGGTTISLPDEMMEKHNVFREASVYRVTPEQTPLYKKPMGPFQVHTLSKALLDRQLGNISSFGVEGLFAVLTGHGYYKEISLTGKSETNLFSVSGTDNDMISEKKGFEDGTSWSRELRSMVKKGEVKCEIAPMFGWTVENLKPERLVLIYSFSAYMESTPQRVASYAAMIRRIESSKQIPAPIEIAKLFGFESVEALEADWKLFITEGKFK